MALREDRGVFRLEAPVVPQWEELPVPGDLHVRALVPGRDRELWALVRPAEASRSARTLLDRFRRAVAGRGRPDQLREELPLDAVPLLGHRHADPAPASAHILAWRPDGGWSAQAAFAPRMDALAVLHDGTVAAGGDRLLALRSGDGTWSEHDAPARLTRVWGASTDCLYALGERTLGSHPLRPGELNVPEILGGLFHFNGRTWAEVDLSDMPGSYVAGGCDASGYGWIVGTYATHSCMARGRGAAWERDGCGSWYLDRVYVGRTGRAYALGGDGLWRLQERRWLGVESFGPIGWPLALADIGGLPWVISSQSLMGWMDSARSVSGVDFFMGRFWVTLETPRGSRDQRESLTCAISPRGEVCLGAGGGVWRSPPLEEVVPRVWPPHRLTPHDDPQLASGDSLVRGWSALEGSAGLKEWAWLGRGLIGAVTQGRGTALVRWRELSQLPETIGEFDFRVAALTPAPGDRQVVLVPEVISDEGVLQGARRLVLVSLDTGGVREMPLPPGFECEVMFTDVAWSPDGSRFLVRPKKRTLRQDHEEVLIFRADDLALERTLALPPGAHFLRWAAEGHEVALEALLPGPFHEVRAAWVDPVTGGAKNGRHRRDVSPSGRYRVAIEWGELKVTTMADGGVRRFAPTPGGVLDLYKWNPAWVGDRLELTARLLGPVHLDLATLRLHYALPVRNEFDAEPQWSPDGMLVLVRTPDAVDPATRAEMWSWSWGAVDAGTLG